MDKNENGYALVVMTNGDTYYISEYVTMELRNKLISDGKIGVCRTFIDCKSGAAVTININNVSSIVVRSDSNAN